MKKIIIKLLKTKGKVLKVDKVGNKIHYIEIKITENGSLDKFK